MYFKIVPLNDEHQQGVELLEAVYYSNQVSRILLSKDLYYNEFVVYRTDYSLTARIYLSAGCRVSRSCS
jgi:hypothetical protein